MPFLELTLGLEGLVPEAAEAVAFDSGALSVTLTDGRDDAVLEPAPGEVRLWPATRMQALFAHGTDVQELIATVARELTIDPDAHSGERG